MTSKNVIKGEKLFRRMVFTCMNRQCENFEKELRTDDVELEAEIEVEAE